VLAKGAEQSQLQPPTLAGCPSAALLILIPSPPPHCRSHTQPHQPPTQSELPLSPEDQARVQAGRPDYHITLWHADDPLLGPDQVLRDALTAAVGSEALLEVVAVDVSAEVIAAEVREREGRKAAGGAWEEGEEREIGEEEA
jgi:hypothetical protein